MTIALDRTFTEQDGTIEDAEKTVTPALPTISPEQEADMGAAHDYIDTLPVGLRGKDLAREVVYIVENFPAYHDQGVVCDESRACMVGWTGVLSAEPLLTAVIRTNVVKYGEDSVVEALDDLGVGDLHFPEYEEWQKNGYMNDEDDCLYACWLLGIPEKRRAMRDSVYNEVDRPLAVHNFKVLTGLEEGVLGRLN